MIYPFSLWVFQGLGVLVPLSWFLFLILTLFSFHGEGATTQFVVIAAETNSHGRISGKDESLTHGMATFSIHLEFEGL